MRPRTNFRILNVGPDPEAQRLLGELAQTEEGISLHHIEVGSVALEFLTHLPESDLPSIVIIPFRFAILTSHDFILSMQAHERLSAIPVLVWGPEIELWEMGQLCREGATSVLLGDFSNPHLDAVRHFWRAWAGHKPVLTARSLPEVKKSIFQKDSRASDRDFRLGTLFLWSGCISAACWVWSVFRFGTSYTLIDLAPVSVHISLTCAGLFLIIHHVKPSVTK